MAQQEHFRILPVMRSLPAFAFLLATVALAQRPPSPTTLAKLRDDFRPLLLFASSPDDPAMLAQLHMLKDAAPGLDERNVLLVAIPFRDPSPTPVSLSEFEATSARRRFHVPPPEFCVLLLGKDGEEKFRSTKPVSFTKLRNLIDIMPMRHQEMRDRFTQ